MYNYLLSNFVYELAFHYICVHNGNMNVSAPTENYLAISSNECSTVYDIIKGNEADVGNINFELQV